MGYQNGYAAKALEHLLDFPFHLLPQKAIQRRKRLIQQNHIRLCSQHPCHGCPLLLTARKHSGIQFCHFRQIKPLQKFLQKVLFFFLPEGKGDILSHRHIGKQGIILEQIPDFSFLGFFGDFFLTVEQDFIIQLYFPLVRLQNTRQTPQGDAFAAAAAPQNTQHFIFQIQRNFDGFCFYFFSEFCL